MHTRHAVNSECAAMHKVNNRLVKTKHESSFTLLLQFLALAQPAGLSILMWRWTLLRSCSRLVCQSARSLILGQPCLLPWGLRGLTASSRTVPAPQLRLLGSWAPFWADYLASVITRCRYTMCIMMIALLFMCRCGLWVRDLLLFRPLFSLNSSGIWCCKGISIWRSLTFSLTQINDVRQGC